MKKKIDYYCYIRAIACLAVVLVHLSVGAATIFAADASRSQILLTNCIYNNMMWAVPCFLMVSGALLLAPGKILTGKKIFQKYIMRMLLSIIIFTLLYEGLELLVNGEAFSWERVGEGCLKILTGESWSHMWYLYLMVGIYLMLPIYKIISDHCQANLMRYLLLLLVLFLAIVPILKIWNISSGFYIFTSVIYPFYFLAGGAISQGKLRLPAGCAVGMLVLGTIGVTVCSWLMICRGMSGLALFTKYNSIFVILQSVGIFTIFQSAAEKARQRAEEAVGKRFDEISNELSDGRLDGNVVDSKTKGGSLRVVKKILLWIDDCSFGIYLLHLIFIRGVLKHLPVTPYGNSGIWQMLGIYVGSILCSYWITWLLKKIPAVRRIV